MDRYLYAHPSVSGEHFHPLKTWNREAWQRIGSRFRGQTASDGFSSLNVNYSFTCHSESTKDIVRKRNTQREYSCSFSPASLSMMALSILNICWGKRVFETWRGSHRVPQSHLLTHSSGCNHSTYIITAAGPIYNAPLIQWWQIIYLQSSVLQS